MKGWYAIKLNLNSSWSNPLWETGDLPSENPEKNKSQCIGHIRLMHSFYTQTRIMTTGYNILKTFL